jgi:4-hydroxy-2-oxoheptanedioate aldolase
MAITHLAQRLRDRERLVGYWVTSDNPPGTERIAAAGYDYVCLDAQHGLLDDAGLLRGVMAAELGGAAAVARVPANDLTCIGRALDMGARAVIVPLVETVEQASSAARACRYPPHGGRSYGPARSGLRIGPAPRDAEAEIACIAMIETRAGLDNVAAICATEGIDGVYVGPADLSISLFGGSPQEGWERPEFPQALAAIRAAAAAAGVAVGLHTFAGAGAARALADGFDFVSIDSDLAHLSAAAAQHLSAARGG